MSRVTATFRIAPEPVERVHSIRGNRVLQQKYFEPFVGVRLTTYIRNPGNTPFGVVVILAVGKNFQHALVIASGFCAVEQNPIIIPRLHVAFFGPLASRIFLAKILDRSKHGRFVFDRTLELRQDKQAFGIYFGVGRDERRNYRQRGLELYFALRQAQLCVLPCRICGIVQHPSQFFEFRPRLPPFVRVEKRLRALLLHLGGGVRKFAAQSFLQHWQSGARSFRFIAERVLVVDRLIVFRGANGLSRCLVSMSAVEQQSWF